MTTKINNSTKFIYNNIDNLVLIDKYCTLVPNIFNEFTGQVIYKCKSINIGKRILKKINTINCDCQIQLNQLVYKITSGIEYNIDFVNYEIDFAQIKIFPDDKQSKWGIQIEMSDEPESINYSVVINNLHDELIRYNIFKYDKNNNNNSCYT